MTAGQPLPDATGLDDDFLWPDDALPAQPTSTEDTAPAPVELADGDRDMLEFERQWWRHAGSKEQAIRERFGIAATRYYQRLNALIDLPAALEFDPVVVGRLRRLRASRSARRTGRGSRN
jgi:hypothetical protein